MLDVHWGRTSTGWRPQQDGLKTVSSGVCDLGHVGDLQELGLCFGANHTHLAQEAEELREPARRYGCCCSWCRPNHASHQ